MATTMRWVYRLRTQCHAGPPMMSLLQLYKTIFWFLGIEECRTHNLLREALMDASECRAKL
jgi:hypothetical protein